MSHLLPSSGSAMSPVLHSSAAFYPYSHSVPRHTCHLDSHSGSVTGLQPPPSHLPLTYSSQSQNDNMVITAHVTKGPSSHKPLPGPLLRKAHEAPLSSALSPDSRPTSLHRDTTALLSPTRYAVHDARLMRLPVPVGLYSWARTPLRLPPLPGAVVALSFSVMTGSFPPQVLSGYT